MATPRVAPLLCLSIVIGFGGAASAGRSSARGRGAGVQEAPASRRGPRLRGKPRKLVVGLLARWQAPTEEVMAKRMKRLGRKARGFDRHTREALRRVDELTSEVIALHKASSDPIIAMHGGEETVVRRPFLGSRVGRVSHQGDIETSSFAFAGARHPMEWEALAQIERRGPIGHDLEDRRVEMTGNALLGYAEARETDVRGTVEHRQFRLLGFGISSTETWVPATAAQGRGSKLLIHRELSFGSFVLKSWRRETAR